MRTSKLIAGSTGAAFTALLSGALLTASWAQAPAMVDSNGGQAASQVAELSLLGRRAVFGGSTAGSTLDTAAGRLDAGAAGVGSSLAPTLTRSEARWNDPALVGGKQCATPALRPALESAGNVPGTPGLATIDMSPVCAESAVSGNADAFTARSATGLSRLSVGLPATVADRVGEVLSSLDPSLLASPVGDLLTRPPDAVTQPAVDAVNGLLGSIAPQVAIPQLEPTQSVSGLLNRLRSAELVRIELVGGSALNAGDPASFLSEALNGGGRIDVLPELRGAGTPPLLRITVAEARAAVAVDRLDTTATPTVKETVVRLESDLLDRIGISGPPVSGGTVHGIPLAAVPGGNLPVVGGMLGGGLPLEQLVGPLGLKAAPGSIEIGPGQSVSVLCDGPLAPLCTEISVSPATAPVVLSNGMTRSQSAVVLAHLFKGLDNLAPGTRLGTALADPALAEAIAPLAGASGLELGEATTTPGIRLTMAAATAEAAGTRVAGATELPAEPAATPAGAPPEDPAPLPAPSLPRTGAPFDATAVPWAFTAAAALLAATRRLRRSA